MYTKKIQKAKYIGSKIMHVADSAVIRATAGLTRGHYLRQVLTLPIKLIFIDIFM